MTLNVPCELPERTSHSADTASWVLSECRLQAAPQHQPSKRRSGVAGQKTAMRQLLHHRPCNFVRTLTIIILQLVTTIGISTEPHPVMLAGRRRVWRRTLPWETRIWWTSLWQTLVATTNGTRRQHVRRAPRAPAVIPHQPNAPSRTGSACTRCLHACLMQRLHCCCPSRSAGLGALQHEPPPCYPLPGLKTPHPYVNCTPATRSDPHLLGDTPHPRTPLMARPSCSQGFSAPTAAFGHAAAAGHGLTDSHAGFHTPPPRQQQQRQRVEPIHNLVSCPGTFVSPEQVLQDPQQTLAEATVPASFQVGLPSSQSFDGRAVPQMFNPFSGDLRVARPPWLAGSRVPMGAVHVASGPAPLQRGMAAQARLPRPLLYSLSVSTPLVMSFCGHRSACFGCRHRADQQGVCHVGVRSFARSPGSGSTAYCWSVPWRCLAGPPAAVPHSIAGACLGSASGFDQPSATGGICEHALGVGSPAASPAGVYATRGSIPSSSCNTVRSWRIAAGRRRHAHVGCCMAGRRSIRSRRLSPSGRPTVAAQARRE